MDKQNPLLSLSFYLYGLKLMINLDPCENKPDNKEANVILNASIVSLCYMKDSSLHSY